MEIGIDSFAAKELRDDANSAISSGNALAELLERMEYADKVGLDVFGIGEHYRKEFLDSASAIILSAAAGLFVQAKKGPVLLNYGLEECRFTKPIYAGATIGVRLTVKEKIDQEPSNRAQRLSTADGGVS